MPKKLITNAASGFVIWEKGVSFCFLSRHRGKTGPKELVEERWRKMTPYCLEQ
jgi:hypothetical protein